MKTVGYKILFTFFIFLSTAHAARPIRGFYQVPVSPELTSYANYPVKFEPDNYQNIPSQINFPMPAVLVGEETYVAMAKVPGQSTAWEGPNVTGNCQIVDRYFRCQVQFTKLSIDANKLTAAIQAKYQTSDEIAGRLKVASLFSAEPIGIISYKLRGKTRP
jgi:hypothetical protein